MKPKVFSVLPSFFMLTVINMEFSDGLGLSSMNEIEHETREGRSAMLRRLSSIAANSTSSPTSMPSSNIGGINNTSTSNLTLMANKTVAYNSTFASPSMPSSTIVGINNTSSSVSTLMAQKARFMHYNDSSV